MGRGDRDATLGGKSISRSLKFAKRESRDRRDQGDDEAAACLESLVRLPGYRACRNVEEREGCQMNMMNMQTILVLFVAAATACQPLPSSPTAPQPVPPTPVPAGPATPPTPPANTPGHGYRLDFRPAETFRGTQMLRQANNLAYAYVTTHAAVDADGAPNAYHPADRGKDCRNDPHIGLDCPGNAGFGVSPAPWWKEVLVPDPNDPAHPYVQTTGEFRGFYVAMTKLGRPGGVKRDPATYVDSTKVPYVVLPSGFTSEVPNGARVGDVGVAAHLSSGRRTAFIVADEGGGNDARLGEGSIALYAALGFPNANPRTGAGTPRDDVQYIIFPGSRRSGAALWPRTNQDIAQQAMQLVNTTPGIRAAP
jgi:hypothetical protein